MMYLALLRGINVGGNTRVEMLRLKRVFEKLGFHNIKTLINSGNVIFGTSNPNVTNIKAAIEKEFGFYVPVVLRNFDELDRIIKAVPTNWANDHHMKCYVMFLWKEIDNQDILKSLPTNPDIEDIMYVPGAVIWRIDRINATRGKMINIIGTGIYKKMTVRNINTVRKIHALMQAA